MKTPGGGGYGHSDDTSSTDLSTPISETGHGFVERGTVYNYSQAQESA